MPNHIDSLEQIHKILQQSSHMVDASINCYVEGIVSSKLQPLIEDKSENECVQQSKEMEKCACDRNEGNEEMSKSEVRTLPLCFSSFKVLKQNVNNVSDQKPYRYDVEFEERNRLANERYLPLCFSSFNLLRANHEKAKKVGKSVVVQSHLPSSEIDEDIHQDFQQDKVFQSCLSSPMNNVVVQILSGLNRDEDSEAAYMEIPSNRQVNNIEF